MWSQNNAPSVSKIKNGNDRGFVYAAWALCQWHLLLQKHNAIRKLIFCLCTVPRPQSMSSFFFWNHSAYWKCQIHLGSLYNKERGTSRKSFILFYWPLNSIRKITGGCRSHVWIQTRPSMDISPVVRWKLFRYDWKLERAPHTSVPHLGWKCKNVKKKKWKWQ